MCPNYFFATIFKFIGFSKLSGKLIPDCNFEEISLMQAVRYLRGYLLQLSMLFSLYLPSSVVQPEGSRLLVSWQRLEVFVPLYLWTPHHGIDLH